MTKNILLKTLIITFIIYAGFALFNIMETSSTPLTDEIKQSPATPTPTATPIPGKKILENGYHVFQTFNNCGPASLSMTLSYFGVNKTQQELGQALRPYQNANGDNDDKSVTLDEMANKAEEYDLLAYHRPNGTIELLKKLIANDIPVITRTWLKTDEDIGHYRIIKGYDESAKIIIQDDSFQGKDLAYAYDDFNLLWEKFNYEYLVLVPKNKKQIAEAILGEDVDKETAWEKAAKNIQEQLKINPENIYARFNLSVAYYNIGDFQKSVNEYEKIESQLPWRTLWYQIEPIKAYFALDNYEKVFSITYGILNNENRAFSELYVLRGEIFQKQKKLELAKSEFENARFYNQNLKISM